jgi:hypothetical protein
VRIAYVGFVQRGSTRFYQFDGIVERRPGQIARHTLLTMTADMAIVSRFHLKYQDLPALCMSALSAAVEKGAGNDCVPGSYALTEADVEAHSAPPVATRARPRKPFAPRPSANSQFVWPRKS